MVLLRVDTGRMTSEDDVRRLRGEGLSIRAIADELGLSKSAVHRMLAAAEDDDGGDDDGGLLFDPEPVLAEPFTYCGVEVEIVQHRGEDPCLQESERWLDGTGRSCSVLDIWRYYTHRAGDHGDYETEERVCADMARQRAAWVSAP